MLLYPYKLNQAPKPPVTRNFGYTSDRTAPSRECDDESITSSCTPRVDSMLAYANSLPPSKSYTLTYTVPRSLPLPDRTYMRSRSYISSVVCPGLPSLSLDPVGNLMEEMDMLGSLVPFYKKTANTHEDRPADIQKTKNVSRWDKIGTTAVGNRAAVTVSPIQTQRRTTISDFQQPSATTP